MTEQTKKQVQGVFQAVIRIATDIFSVYQKADQLTDSAAKLVLLMYIHQLREALADAEKTVGGIKNDAEEAKEG